MSTSAPVTVRPWYREYWVWLLMIPPAASVAGGFTMAYLATSEPVALVVDDYARIEEISEQRFERDARAAALGLRADFRFETDGSGHTGIAVSLAATRAPPYHAALILHLQHATRRDADRTLTLVRVGDFYTAQAELASGRYAVELLAPDETWRLGGSLTRVPGTLTLTAQDAAE